MPVESEFDKEQLKDNNAPAADKKVIGPVNMADEFKKDTSKSASKTPDGKTPIKNRANLSLSIKTQMIN